MEIEGFKLHRRARMAMLQLESEEQTQVRERLAMLATLPPSEWPADLVSRLPADPSLYLARVDDSLRLIIGLEDGGPVVLAIIRQETLDTLAQAAARSGH